MDTTLTQLLQEVVDVHLRMAQVRKENDALKAELSRVKKALQAQDIEKEKDAGAEE